MPTVDVDYDELRRLTGREEKTDDDLEWDLFNLGLEYEGETEDGLAQLEFEADRLDRLSVEGIARSLRYQYGEDRGVSVPTTTPPEWTIVVDEDVPAERPYVTGAVIRDVDLGGDALESLIQLQEKLHATMGRKRAKGAIGVHDLTMLKGREAQSASDRSSGDGREPRNSPATEGEATIRYTGVEPDGDRFVPLDSDAELTPGEVLETHPTGREYADLVSEYERYPAIYDDLGLFSFPPVINGRRTEVTEDSRDLFVEMTGTDQWTIDKMCTIICYALDARGATVEEVRVVYPETWPPEGATGNAPSNALSDMTLVRPDLSTTTKTVSHDRIESVLGIDLSVDDVVDLLERSGLGVALVGEADAVVGNSEAVGADESESQTASDSGADVDYEVEVPPYRVDVLHPLDVIDDIGRAYGFNDLEPRYPEIGTVGGRHGRSRLEDAVRTQLVGLGFEDLLNFHLIGEAELFDRMGLTPDDPGLGAETPVRIGEPYSEAYECLRTWVLPSLLMVLENNTHRAYPQDLAEIGFVACVDETQNTGVAEGRHVAAVLARHDAAYEDAKARLQALARRFDVDLETPPVEHPSFIDGRTAAVVVDGESVGVIGEVHPRVLVEHDLELPVAAFEFDLPALE